jgi:bacillithiol biosynthesis cysteine-adding enzyme BshC
MQSNDTQTEVNHINYVETGFFSKIVIDYLQGKEQLSAFYKYKPNLDGIREAIEDRSNFNYDRSTLVAALQKQYAGVATSEKLQSNLQLLLKENTFTVTTAHQPNIFTGPLYFIYKILHAVKLAEKLKEEFPQNNFVPVYYMGSEDADLDELGNFTVDGKRYEWKTKQTGAVGRMKVDKPFLSLIEQLNAQLCVLPKGEEIISIFRSAYAEGETLQDCTLRLVNELFGEFGLVVLIPDTSDLKKLFIPVLQRELLEQFSLTAVESTIDELSQHYKVQAGGRELNLFYLVDDKRERIEANQHGFAVSALGKKWSKDEMLIELNQHPERFSPNVILRGVFQEMILPNVAFIGGGGEIAYWLELKKVFEEAKVPYPVLVLRNSFLLMTEKETETLSELGFSIKDVFNPAEQLLNRLTKRESANQLSLSEEIGELNTFYQQLHETTAAIDPTLAEHVNALQVKALKRIQELEKKMLRAEKRKFEAEKRRIQKIKDNLFPKDSLQERIENVSGFYANYGKELINKIYQSSRGIEQQFTVITL